jgi:hypothetical protein
MRGVKSERVVNSRSLSVWRLLTISRDTLGNVELHDFFHGDVLGQLQRPYESLCRRTKGMTQRHDPNVLSAAGMSISIFSIPNLGRIYSPRDNVCRWLSSYQPCPPSVALATPPSSHPRVLDLPLSATCAIPSHPLRPRLTHRLSRLFLF